MSRNYRVITQHGDHGETLRTRWFDTADAAQSYAESFDPETDHTLRPNVTAPTLDAAIKNDTYFKGFFWNGNRYAAIITANR